jgi:hypothetical protein
MYQALHGIDAAKSTAAGSSTVEAGGFRRSAAVRDNGNVPGPASGQDGAAGDGTSPQAVPQQAEAANPSNETEDTGTMTAEESAPADDAATPSGAPAAAGQGDAGVAGPAEENNSADTGVDRTREGRGEPAGRSSRMPGRDAQAGAQGILPKTAAEDDPRAWGDRDEDHDAWLKEQKPPHWG